MIDDKMRDDYDEYLNQHISNVKLGFDWLLMKFPDLFAEYDAEALGQQMAKHDNSKWDDEEWYAYCEYFYGNEKTEEVKEEFDKAWLHHQHNNPHHWQHWLLREDDGGTKAIEMPNNYVLEMVCDHWAFSWIKNDLYEIFNWYDKNKSKMILHDKTRKLYEDILDRIKKELDK